MNHFHVGQRERDRRLLRPAPRVEGLEHRLLFAAIVTSVAGDDDAIFSAALQFMQGVGGYPPWNEDTGATLRGSRDITGLESTGEVGSFGPPANMPGTFYRDEVPWGLLLSTPGTGFRTSGTFGEINPTYP